MGFKYWYEGFIFIAVFFLIIGAACFCIAWFGSRMINELGNHPTRAAQIQLDAGLKLLIVEVLAFGALVVFFRVFS